MLVLKIKNKEYKVKYGFNSFCDSDLMDRVADMMRLMNDDEVLKDENAAVKRYMADAKELFLLIRELLYIGFKRHNPVKTLQEVGFLLDDYNEESTEDDPRDLATLFQMILTELTDEGFLKGLVDNVIADSNSTKKKTAKTTK